MMLRTCRPCARRGGCRSSSRHARPLPRLAPTHGRERRQDGFVIRRGPIAAMPWHEGAAPAERCQGARQPVRRGVAPEAGARRRGLNIRQALASMVNESTTWKLLLERPCAEATPWRRRDIDILLGVLRLALSIGPIAAAAVAATQEVADLRETAAARKIATAIAWQIAPDIANATLRVVRLDTLIAIATMGDAAAIGHSGLWIESPRPVAPIPYHGWLLHSAPAMSSGNSNRIFNLALRFCIFRVPHTKCFLNLCSFPVVAVPSSPFPMSPGFQSGF